MKVMIKGPDHVAYSVQNLDTMVNFYHNILGMELVMAEEYRAGTFPFISVRAGEMLIDLIPLKEKLVAGEGRQRLSHICLRLEDGTSLAELKNFLQEKDIAITGEAANNFGAYGRGASLYVRDPEGNSLELKVYPAA